jgi:hypothetical protein
VAQKIAGLGDPIGNAAGDLIGAWLEQQHVGVVLELPELGAGIGARRLARGLKRHDAVLYT